MVGLVALCIQVRSSVNGCRHVPDGHLKSLLHLLQHGSILVVPNKSDRQTLCAKAASTSNPVEIGITILWHIIVDHDVNALNVNTTPKKISGHHNSFLELFKLLVASNSVFLVQT